MHHYIQWLCGIYPFIICLFASISIRYPSIQMSPNIYYGDLVGSIRAIWFSAINDAYRHRSFNFFIIIILSPFCFQSLLSHGILKSELQIRGKSSLSQSEVGFVTNQDKLKFSPAEAKFPAQTDRVATSRSFWVNGMMLHVCPLQFLYSLSLRRLTNKSHEVSKIKNHRIALNLTGASTAILPRRPSNFTAISWLLIFREIWCNVIEAEWRIYASVN